MVGATQTTRRSQHSAAARCSPESGQCTLLHRSEADNWTMYVLRVAIIGRHMFPGNAQCIYAQAPPARHEPPTAGDGHELDRATPLPPNWLVPCLQSLPPHDQFWWWGPTETALGQYSNDLICSLKIGRTRRSQKLAYGSGYRSKCSIVQERDERSRLHLCDHRQEVAAEARWTSLCLAAR